jgi:fatty acid desaturase
MMSALPSYAPVATSSSINENSRPRRHDLLWRDLVPLTTWEKALECSLSLPWLFLSCFAYDRLSHTGSLAWFVIGCTGSFFFFLTGLRQSHNAQHRCLGIGRRGHDGMLFLLSVLMLASMHAVRVTHLHHHHHCLHDEDFEAAHSNEPWWKVVLLGPLFVWRLHLFAWHEGDASCRRWILAELLAVAGVVTATQWGLGGDWLRWHVSAMIVGECCTAFFAVWIVHHGCEADGQIARTQRGWLRNFLSYSMFYHLEHHLYPAVPTCHLPRLAERLDRQAPHYRHMQVIG